MTNPTTRPFMRLTNTAGAILTLAAVLILTNLILTNLPHPRHIAALTPAGLAVATLGVIVLAAALFLRLNLPATYPLLNRSTPSRARVVGMQIARRWEADAPHLFSPDPGARKNTLVYPKLTKIWHGRRGQLFLLVRFPRSTAPGLIEGEADRAAEKMQALWGYRALHRNPPTLGRKPGGRVCVFTVETGQG